MMLKSGMEKEGGKMSPRIEEEGTFGLGIGRAFWVLADLLEQTMPRVNFFHSWPTFSQNGTHCMCLNHDSLPFLCCGFDTAAERGNVDLLFPLCCHDVFEVRGSCSR